MTVAMHSNGADWPPLPFAAWQDTFATLHMWTQLVGKTRLALAPMENHWWQCTLYVTARGLTTGPMPSGARLLSADPDAMLLQFLESTYAAAAACGNWDRVALERK